MLIGATALSGLPIVGPVVGGLVGGLIGGMAGSKFGETVYDGVKSLGKGVVIETGVRYVVFLAVCGLLFQIVLFERKSERGVRFGNDFS